MDVLCAQNLTKKFGAQTVLDSLSFTVPEHSIFGFIGQNGAGKTTAMKIVLGLLKADSGSVSVCGQTVKFGQTKTNESIGYLPDVPEFYGYMRPKEYLRLCGEITGLSNEKIKTRSDELLSLVGLHNVNKRIQGFSRGMKQRLGFAQALLNEPKLLICDEPTSALDPIGRKEILDILQKIRGKTTVIFSTHILSDVERVCDRIAILDKGKLILAGTLAELKEMHKADCIIVEFASRADKEAFAADRQIAPYIADNEMDGASVRLCSGDVSKMEMIVLDVLVQRKLPPLKLDVMEPTIESLFMELVKK